MVLRWDALLLAAVLSGGSMLIESSHRIDTGLADDATQALPACAGAVVVRADAPTASDDAADTRVSVNAADDDDAAPTCD